MTDNDLMHIHNPTDRDLLVRLLTEIEGIKKRIDNIDDHLEKKDDDQRDLLVDLTVVKTKVIMWGSVAAFIVSSVMGVVFMVIDHVVK